MTKLRVAVVGAGVNGLAAAWQLALLGARVVVLEQFRLGHDRGSSHGASRITRTSYHDPRYARLAIAARDAWPQLEQDAGTRLIHPVPGVFFGPAGGQVDGYARAAQTAGAPVDAIDAAEARRRFPQFRFDAGPTVLVDRSAGVVDAAATMQALARLCVAAGVEIREESPVDCIDAVDADRVVVTAGAWVRRLVPSLAQRLAVARQTVCYFEPDGPADDFRLPRFPVWVWLGADEHDHFYGLPEFGRPGIKAARHATGTGSDDPDAPPASPPAGAIDDVRDFLARELVRPPRSLVAWERCLYTNEPRQDFVIGALDGDPRVVVGAACSGHAFKFAPLTGRVLAELALFGRTTVPEFDAIRGDLAP